MYETVDVRDRRFLVPFGNFCNATQQLPASILLSAELIKCDGALAIDSGGLTDVWKGEHQDIQVAIKAFRASSAENLEEAKQVRVE